MKSLSVEGVAVVSGVANGKRNMVGGDLVADLSRGLDDGLDHRGVSNGTDRGKGSRGDNWGSSVGESGVTNNDSRVSLSLPLHNSVGKGQSVAKTVVASVSHSGNSGGSNDWMVDHRADGGVVDQGGGGGENGGTSSNDSRVSLSIPLHNSVGQGESVAKTMVASISDSSNSGGGNHRVVDHRAHRGVVDQGGGGGEDSGASGNDGGVSLSLPLAIVAEAVVANGHGNSVCSNFMADLGRSHLNRLDDRVAGNSTNGGEAESCGSRDHRGSGVRESGENLRVGLRGGRGRGNNCLRLKVLVSVRFFLGGHLLERLT
jgi:hypothetical protein